jgi:hypothetical protein
VPYINCPKLSLSQSASPSVVLSALLLIDIPWFLNWGKTCCYLHQTFSWGFQLAGYLLHQLGSISGVEGEDYKIVYGAEEEAKQ